MPIDFNGAGLTGPAEVVVDVARFLAHNPNKPYMDTRVESEAFNCPRGEYTGILVDLEQATHASVDVTLFSMPPDTHIVIPLEVAKIHKMRIIRVWRAGTTATTVQLFGIAV